MATWSLAALAALAVAVAVLATWRLRRVSRPIPELLTAERFRSIFTESPVGIGLSDEHGHFLTANAALCRLFGREESELVGHSSLGFTHPEDQPGHSKARSLIEASPDGIARVEKRYVRPSGEVRWAWLTINRVFGPEGQPWTLAHIQDVTDRHLSEQALRDSEANLAAVASVVRRIRTGEDARASVVRAARELANASSATLLEPLDDRWLHATAADGPVPVGTTIDLTESSVTTHVWQTAEALFVPDLAEHPLSGEDLRAIADAQSALLHPVVAHGRITGILSVTWDATVPAIDDRARLAVAMLADETAVALEHDLLLERFSLLATTDSLTGAPNRRAWDERLPALMGAATRAGGPLTIAMIDLDHFKMFNDRYGHVRGDELLREMAGRIGEQLRAVDFLARWGGEEFVVALPDCDETAARFVLSRLREAVPDGQTCSVGYAVWDGQESGQRVVARADAALYRAKEAGRDCVFAAVPQPRAPAKRSLI